MILLILYGTTEPIESNNTCFVSIVDTHYTAPFPEPTQNQRTTISTATSSKKQLGIATFSITNKNGTEKTVNLPDRKNTFANMTKLTALLKKYIQEYQVPRDALKEGYRYRCVSEHPNLCLLVFGFLNTISAIPGIVLASEYPQYVSYCVYISAAVLFVVQVLHYIFFHPTTKMSKFDKTREKFDKNIAALLLNFNKSDRHTLIKYLNDIFGYGQEFTEKFKYTSALIDRKLIKKYGLHEIMPLPDPQEEGESENDDDTAEAKKLN